LRKRDEIKLYGWNNGFRDSLSARHIHYTYYPYTGGHSNKLPERFPISLKFLDAAMGHHGHEDDDSSSGSTISQNFKLDQNYPNPFNPVTRISYSIPKAGFVKIAVYDMLGREAETLVNEQLQPGTYDVEFDGSKLSSGVYYYKLVAGEFTSVKKMTLIK
jgi:hypothetical protein